MEEYGNGGWFLVKVLREGKRKDPEPERPDPARELSDL